MIEEDGARRSNRNTYRASSNGTLKFRNRNCALLPPGSLLNRFISSFIGRVIEFNLVERKVRFNFHNDGGNDGLFLKIRFVKICGWRIIGNWRGEKYSSVAMPNAGTLKQILRRMEYRPCLLERVRLTFLRSEQRSRLYLNRSMSRFQNLFIICVNFPIFAINNSRYTRCQEIHARD